ncbi:hypothetical protein [Thermopirellula anaerolimosa]
MAHPGKATFQQSAKARPGGDPLGWIVRIAVLATTFATVMWLSRPLADAPGIVTEHDSQATLHEATGGSLRQKTPALPQDRWEAWLAARERSQKAFAEYAAVARQMQWAWLQHVAALHDARRYGTELLAKGSIAVIPPSATAGNTAAAERTNPTEQERQRWAFLKGYLARLEMERAQLSATHTPAHPEVAQLDAMIAEVRSEMRQLERWIDHQGAFARDGYRLESNHEASEPPAPHRRDLATAVSRPPVGNGLSGGLREEPEVSTPETVPTEAFREAMRDLAAGEATLSQLLEHATAAGQELQAALCREEASAAALQEAWRDFADRSASAPPVTDRAGPATTAANGRSQSSFGLRGTLAAALSLLATIAAGWIWNGLRSPEEISRDEPPPRRYWRADGAEPLPAPKLLGR